MNLRPSRARWFEVLTDREHLGATLGCLAATGAVELEARSGTGAVQALPDYRAVLAAFREFERRYGPYWPAPVIEPGLPPPESLAGAEDALASLRAWATEAEAPVQRAEALGRELAELDELLAVVRAGGDALPSPRALGAAGPMLATRLYALDPGTTPELPAGVLALPLEVPAATPAGGRRDPRRYVLAVGTRADVAALDATLGAQHARALGWPADLPAGRAEAAAALSARRAALARTLADVTDALAAIAARHRLAGRLAGLRFLDWLVHHVPRLPATEHFAWVTGWTDDLEGERLAAALAAAGLPHVLHFPDPPRTLVAPTVLRHGRWLAPFESFARLLGTPGAGEPDPTLPVALLAPVLFGFMFGDAGQGAVLLAAGLLLRGRVPVLGLLVPGGVAAIAFGIAFGAVFAREDWLAAAWLRPLERPLDVLLASVALGVLVIVAGLALDALTHAWRGEGRRWLRRRGGLALLYAGLVAGPFWAPALALVPVGAGAVAIGGAREAGDPRAAGPALGELLETTLQLAVNTVSFTRVGAFALAHAGLSAAVVALAASAGGGLAGALALAAGNGVILVLEGMVVGVQTTRLVLFEFFVRFLRAEGRPFRPLPPPVARMP